MAPAKPVLLEPVLSVKKAVLEEGEGRWKQVAREQMGVIFNADRREMMEVAKR